MAKKKKEDNATKSSANIEQNLVEQFGDSIFVSGDSVLEQNRKIISLSPKLDIITYGGCKEGSIVFITGKEKWGKSALALNLGKNGQRIPTSDGSPRKIFWLDVEAKLEPKDLKYVDGLKTDKDHFVHVCSSDEKLLTGEDFLNIAESLARGKKECIIVIDSISNLCTTEEFDSEYSKRFMANSPSLTSRFLRKIVQSMAINKNILVCLAHVIANLGYGSAVTCESGGSKIKFAANLHLQGKQMEYWTSGEKTLGQRTKWRCKATSLGAPNREDWSYIRYGTGTCEYTEWAELATDLGYVRKNGAWIKINFGDKEENVQGLDGVASYLKENPEHLEIVKEKAREIFFNI